MASEKEEAMLAYIGTKIIRAKLMTRGDFEAHKVGAKIQPFTPNDTWGYLVEYEDGYQSWSPKEVFESSYRLTSGMPFGLAVEAMKKGFRVKHSRRDGSVYFIDDNSDISCADDDGIELVHEIPIQLIIDDNWQIVDA